MRSIRSRLLVFLIAAQLIAGLLAAWSAFYSANAEFSSFLDSELQQIAESLARRGNASPESLMLVGSAPEHRTLVQIYDSKKNSLYLSEKAKPLPILEERGFSDIRRDGAAWRVFTAAAGSEIIETAQPASVRTGLAVSASLRILQPFLFLIPLTAVLIWLIVGQGLAPLDRTARSVAQRSPESLAPLEEKNLPEELSALTVSINRLMERLSVSLDAQKRFASDAAHELRTPLTAIKLQAQLARRARTPEMLDKALTRLDAGVQRAVHLIEQLLTIARLDPDAARHPFEEVKLAELLETARHDLEPLAAQKNIAIEAVSEDLSVQGLPDALLLMVTNLTDNAIKYTPSGGRIRLSAESTAEGVLVTVADSGPGIPEEDRKRVFERFYRALGTKVSGNGLGLAIVQRIAEIHRAQISVADGLDGRGTAMQIRFPGA